MPAQRDFEWRGFRFVCRFQDRPKHRGKHMDMLVSIDVRQLHAFGLEQLNLGFGLCFDLSWTYPTCEQLVIRNALFPSKDRASSLIIPCVHLYRTRGRPHRFKRGGSESPKHCNNRTGARCGKP